MQQPAGCYNQDTVSLAEALPVVTKRYSPVATAPMLNLAPQLRDYWPRATHDQTNAPRHLNPDVNNLLVYASTRRLTC